MHLTVRTYGLHDTQNGDLTIDGYGDVGFEVSILH
jgi:hypothetical protein